MCQRYPPEVGDRVLQLASIALHLASLDGSSPLFAVARAMLEIDDP
jgi:hypothetical protein